MSVIAVWLKLNEGHVAEQMQAAARQLGSDDGEVLIDFTSVHRVTPRELRAMEEFVDIAQHFDVKTVLRGVNVDVYRVLKLVKLARKFSFVN